VVLALGSSLAGLGCLLAASRGRRGRVFAATAVVAIVVAVIVVARGEGRCDVETAYFCANVTDTSQADPSRRVMRLDTLLHAYVDVDDPKFLGFPYVQRMAEVADVVAPPRVPIDALHIGGGGFTIPRYIAATRAGSQNTVLELDAGVVRLAKRRLALRTGPKMRVRIGDARVTIRDLTDNSYDLVIGDAFAGVSIPWHLTTREAVSDVRRAMRPRGIYALNIIDHAPLEFLRAQARTLRDVFKSVGLIGHPSLLRGVAASSNYIVLASDVHIPARALRARMAANRAGDALVIGRALDRFIGDADLLTDDYAPADQLLTR
jgi:spermidine synthase